MTGNQLSNKLQWMFTIALLMAYQKETKSSVALVSLNCSNGIEFLCGFIMAQLAFSSLL
jgi:hypothetical protein